ncbi:hypothetical protein TRFO_38764 [Tritrichomonas foetus]|uniref:Protein kinase domain-containing protein n=2 Tax=Tritrichomonas foetus TaxID=1144522 RepID=A0A1J4JBM0_9EUKA|nr:hypothetical protein TRFO_38764 [Tritrichomonas foetus]|eukprot:OHS95051.1 hypothetical protein TRFO_38764 [Tritrichomonas foetus]
MNNFGRMLEEGSGVEMSESLAAEYYRKAAETGNSDGMLNYASMLLDGRGVDEDITKAASFFKRAADLGNTYGMVSYGSMLEKGRGVPKNEAEAAKYYQMAANGGEPIGMASYGIMLASGRGVPKDEVAATKYYKMAADLGNTTGLYNYAIMLRDGRGIEEDQKLATKYFKQLADDGEVDGMVYYGMQLEKGRGVEKNDELAAEYYKKAANTGSSRGMTLYGIMVRDGKGVYQSNTDALNYFKMAAEKKYPEGMFNYACMLKDGIGCPKNIELAIRYFQAAANMGHSGAMAKYGQCLKEGDGVTQDTKAAIQYLKLSSDANNADGMFRYAQLLQDGENVEQDYVEAMNLYKKSASIGNSSSMNAIGVMYENGLGVDKSNEKAVHFYKMASDAGNSDGMVNYGTMLEEGRGVEANEEEALKLYKKAADLGNRDAMLNYAGLIEERGNEEESAKHYKMSADNGDIDCMEIYASMLEEGRGVPINLSEASHYRKMIDEIKNTKSKSPSHHNEGINLSPNSNISPCSTNSSFFVARVSDSNFTINLDDYHVLSTISRCDQYDTFLIQDKHSRIKYCAKVLNYQCETQNEQKEFKKIISTFFKVNHYAINKLLGFSLTDFHHHQLPTIVSDYIQFSSLEKVLFQCRMNINFIDFTYTYKMISIYGISTALETMHQNQIIHGDLRPYNILYDHNYRPKIIDAGLNLLLKKFRHSTNNFNENKYVYYIPPEILRNENTEFSAKSDVYAFGFLLFEILTYKKPFDDFPSTDEIISKILEGKRPEIPISISENYRELISNCWSDDLSIRPSFEQISAMLRAPEYLLNGTDEASFNEYIKMVSPMAERKSLLPDYMQFSLTHFNKECVRSADNSDGDACLFVGQSLIEGTNGFDNSPEAGLKYLQAGINVKHPGCYLYLGSLYYDGNIPEYFQLNQEKGLKLIKEAVSFGYDLAMLKLGEIYQANEEDLALIYYKMAAGKGNTDAMVKCGEIFESHDNFEEAFNLYQKAADSGNSKGMLFYGSLLEEGKGCQQNEAEAAKFYQKAAEKGEVDAMENLALMYEEGRGVEKDINKSHIYKSMADKANGVSDNYGISNKFTNSSINSSFIIQKLPNNSGSATVPIENENVLSLDYYLVVDDSYEDNTGPSGKLVLIEDKLSGKKLAAKVLNINVEESQISLGIFDKDIEPLFKVRHLTLAPLKGFSYKDFCKNWIPTIVREYSEGEPLSQIIQNNKERLNPTAILKTLNGTATAIHTLHSCNILHCNIRDTNIIINKDDEPIVVDYGLCSLWDQYSPIDDISKSFPIYNMAPELLKSQIVTYTQASDVYAFGSLIYEIFTKQIPFQGVDSDTVRSHILKSEFPTFPENFPSSFKQLILRCWNANPESRPTMGDIAFELRTLELYLIEGIDVHAYEEYKDKLLNANRKSGIPKFLQSPKLTSGLSKFNSPLQFSLPDRIKNADNGDVDSILYVAKKYIEGGEGFEKDPRKAVHYLEMGLNMKDSEIIYYYGTILETGVLGIPENKIRSNELFNLAASLGNSKAQIKIEQNRSLEIQKITMSDEEAVKKYKADADAGDSQAMVNYGIMLESGRGVEQNEEEAVKYYQQAAIMNNFGGMVNLGAMLEDGRGISQNL